MTPFDYVKSLDSKQYINDTSSYVPFIINKTLSFSVDTVLYANEMNINSNLDYKLQYDYLFHSLRQKNRYHKWIKNKKKDENIEIVQRYFRYNLEKARQALMILTDEQLTKIKKELEGVE